MDVRSGLTAVERRQWDILVVGGLATDYLIHGTKLPEEGEVVLGNSFSEESGCKGFLQAVAAARLGAKVALISKVGIDPRGREILKCLKREGVDTSGVITQPGDMTGAALVSVDQRGANEVVTAPCAGLRLESGDIKGAAKTFADAKVVLVQMEIPVETVATAIELAAGVQAKIVLDPVPARPLSDQLLRLVDVIRLDSKAAEGITGREFRVTDRATARLVAEKLLFRGVAAAVVEGGDEGNLLAWNEHEIWIPRFLINRVDSTGASDAFSAGIAVGLAENLTLPRAFRVGAAAAALATTVLGGIASLPKREDVLRFVEQETWSRRPRSTKAA